MTEQWFLPFAYRRLTVLRESRGDSAAETIYREKLGELWKRADADVRRAAVIDSW